jgi:uncharacterized phage-associated protein
MASVHDVAVYILQKRKGKLSTWKLQKLVYYAQAWHFTWTDAPLFDEPIEAWAHGPVVRALYEEHKREYSINSLPKGNPERLTDDEKESTDIVVKDYGLKSAQWLSDLTHMELPWQQARNGLPPWERGNNVISLESMGNYYSSLFHK